METAVSYLIPHKVQSHSSSCCNVAVSDSVNPMRYYYNYAQLFGDSLQ